MIITENLKQTVMVDAEKQTQRVLPGASKPRENEQPVKMHLRSYWSAHLAPACRGILFRLDEGSTAETRRMNYGEFF